jgi:hypothetical protein
MFLIAMFLVIKDLIPISDQQFRQFVLDIDDCGCEEDHSQEKKSSFLKINVVAQSTVANQGSLTRSSVRSRIVDGDSSHNTLPS